MCTWPYRFVGMCVDTYVALAGGASGRSGGISHPSIITRRPLSELLMQSPGSRPYVTRPGNLSCRYAAGYTVLLSRFICCLARTCHQIWANLVVDRQPRRGRTVWPVSHVYNTICSRRRTIWLSMGTHATSRGAPPFGCRSRLGAYSGVPTRRANPSRVSTKSMLRGKRRQYCHTINSGCLEHESANGRISG